MNEDKVSKFFKKVHSLADDAYDMANGVLDNTFVFVDEFIDQWETNAREKMSPEGEKVNVEPDLKAKIEDIIAHRMRNGQQAQVWEHYINTNTLPVMEHDIDYTNEVWKKIPEDEKTYVRRSPDSPL